jgi:hypothetical protein
LRMAEFFASWGSTPGNTLVAGMTALKAKIPDLITDVKERRKAEADADKVLYELSQAQRQEKLGFYEKAELKKTEAAKLAAKLQENLTAATASFEGTKLTNQRMIDVAGIQERSSKYSADSSKESSKYSTDANIRIAELREESAALDRLANRATAGDNKKFSQYQSASQQEILVNNRVANEENGKQHLSDVKLVSDAGLMKPADMPEGYADRINSAKERIKAREKSWTDQVNTAKKNTQLAYSRVPGVDPTMTSTMSSTDKQALEWASKNPNDPRSAAIKQRLGQ